MHHCLSPSLSPNTGLLAPQTQIDCVLRGSVLLRFALFPLPTAAAPLSTGCALPVVGGSPPSSSLCRFISLPSGSSATLTPTERGGAVGRKGGVPCSVGSSSTPLIPLPRFFGGCCASGLAFPDKLAGSGFLSSPSKAVVLAAARPPPQLRTCSRILFASNSPLVSEAIKSAAADIAKFEGLGAAGASGSPTALLAAESPRRCGGLVACAFLASADFRGLSSMSYEWGSAAMNSDLRVATSARHECSMFAGAARGRVCLCLDANGIGANGFGARAGVIRSLGSGFDDNWEPGSDVALVGTCSCREQ